MGNDQNDDPAWVIPKATRWAMIRMMTLHGSLLEVAVHQFIINTCTYSSMQHYFLSIKVILYSENGQLVDASPVCHRNK